MSTVPAASISPPEAAETRPGPRGRGSSRARASRLLRPLVTEGGAQLASAGGGHREQRAPTITPNQPTPPHHRDRPAAGGRLDTRGPGGCRELKRVTGDGFAAAAGAGGPRGRAMRDGPKVE